MRKSASTVTIFRFLAILCLVGPLHAARADTTAAAKDERKITGWGRPSIILFDQNGVFWKTVPAEQLTLPQTVTDGDFNDDRTRVRITLESNGTNVTAYVDTASVVLSRQPPPSDKPVTTAHPMPPAGQPGGATFGTVAQRSDSGQPSLAAMITLHDPTVVDTATLKAGDKIVPLFGIEGQSGKPAAGLRDFLATNGNQIICSRQPNAEYVCNMPNGTDVAKLVLFNGAARARQDAPETYLDQEKDAQAAGRGVWADLPRMNSDHNSTIFVPDSDPRLVADSGEGHKTTGHSAGHPMAGAGHPIAGAGHHLSAGVPGSDRQSPHKPGEHVTHSPTATKD